MQFRVSVGAIAGLVALALPGAVHADSIFTVHHQGVDRVATLHRPASLPDGPAPLVIALHGLGQGVGGLQQWLHLEEAAERGGFVIAYPEAVERRWSYGRPIKEPMPTINGKTVDDVGFIRETIDGLVEMKIADPNRVYVTGPSRGGLMTYTLICALADRLAAAAPLITGMTDHQRDDCHPSRRIPIMVLAGTNDEAEWYDGQVAPAGRLLSVPETMEFWRERNGCSEETATSLPHRDATDPTNIRLIEWTRCKDHARLRLYRVNEGGHQVPSLLSKSEFDTKKYGTRNRDIETAEEFWSFAKMLSALQSRR